MSALVEAEGVSFSYGPRGVLHDVSLAVGAGEVLALLGPNGSGKTTLLRLMLGLAQPSRGRIHLQGRALKRLSSRARARQLAYVPQLHRESFSYSLLEVALMGRLPHTPFFGRFGQADRRLALRALEDMGVGHLAERSFAEVSGGERQLALIARALAQGGRVLLMDEPTAALDYGNQLRLLARIADLARQGYSVVFSTHHPDHALAVAGRVAMLSQGRLVRAGAAAQVITGGSLAELYGVEVRTVEVDGACVCVPSLPHPREPARTASAREARAGAPTRPPAPAAPLASPTAPPAARPRGRWAAPPRAPAPSTGSRRPGRRAAPGGSSSPGRRPWARRCASSGRRRCRWTT